MLIIRTMDPDQNLIWLEGCIVVMVLHKVLILLQVRNNVFWSLISFMRLEFNTNRPMCWWTWLSTLSANLGDLVVFKAQLVWVFSITFTNCFKVRLITHFDFKTCKRYHILRESCDTFDLYRVLIISFIELVTRHWLKLFWAITNKMQPLQTEFLASVWF